MSNLSDIDINNLKLNSFYGSYSYLDISSKDTIENQANLIKNKYI